MVFVKYTFGTYYFYVKVTFVLVGNGAKNNRLIGHTYNDDKTLDTQTAPTHALSR